MCFKHEDVITVADALMEAAVCIEYQGDISCGHDEWLYECRCCDVKHSIKEKLVHKLDCAVLVAQDLLTE